MALGRRPATKLPRAPEMELLIRILDESYDKKAWRGKVTNLSIITGIAAHDVYHAGQIQLLKRLQDRP